MRMLTAVILLCGVMGANAACPIKKPQEQPVVPDGATASKKEMYEARLAAEDYLLRAEAYLACGYMNQRQHKAFLAQMELFAERFHEEQVEFQVRTEMLAEK